MIQVAYKQYDEKLLSENLEIIQTRELSNTSSDESWVLASNAANELSKPDGPKVAVFEVDGFDTHAAQGGTNGAHADCLSDYDNIVRSLKSSMTKEAFDNTLILTLTEFGRTIKQNSGNGTEHGYGSAVLMAGGLVKKAQVHSDWPGLKRKELFEGRDLNSTIDARSIYASAMSTVFDLDFKHIQKDVFWGENLQNLSDKLFKA
jgi:uncharacterized protein (DUF1501 family)